MARSSKIYVVREEFRTEDGDYDQREMAAFTVKREMVTWLRTFSVRFPDRFGNLYIVVSRDNPSINEWGDSSFVPYDDPEDLLSR